MEGAMTPPHPGSDPSQSLPVRTEPEAPKPGFLCTWANKTPTCGETQVSQEAQGRKQPEEQAENQFLTQWRVSHEKIQNAC